MNNGILSIINHYICDEINDENICKYHLINKIEHIKCVDDAIIYASKYGSGQLFDIIICKYNNVLGRALEEACANNHEEIAYELSDMIINKWNCGLYGASKSGNIKLIDLMVEQGAYNWEMSLCGACECGNIDIIKLAFKNGAKLADNALLHAVKGNKLEIFKLLTSDEEMQKLGIDTSKLFKTKTVSSLLFISFQYGNLEMIKLVLNYIDNYNSLKEGLEFLTSYRGKEFAEEVRNIIKNLNIIY